jgi:hypothetical protein
LAPRTLLAPSILLASWILPTLSAFFPKSGNFSRQEICVPET